jgi:membrane protein DedA with SNARE-associated domain
MWRRILTILSPGLLPFIWAVLFAFFAVLYRLFNLPSPAQTVVFARDLFNNYGVYVLTLAAFVEAIFMISVYFPGSLVIAIAVVISDKSPDSLFTIGLLVWLGFVAALPLNYYLGKEGFYRGLLVLGGRDVIHKMQRWMERRGRTAVLLSACQPSILAFAVVCMGITREGLVRTIFLAAISLIPWVALIIVLLSIITKGIDVTDKNQAWYFIALLVLWGLVLVLKERRWKNSNVRS